MLGKSARLFLILPRKPGTHLNVCLKRQTSK
nr:MAG TPA: hypothetical protein [Caudoviricetes sp.]